MGANFVKGRVAEITEKANGDLVLRYEDIENGGALVEAEYDLVVLAVGVQPNREAPSASSPTAPSALDDYHYVGEADEDLNPGQTNLPGVFVAGAAVGRQGHPRLDPPRRRRRRSGGRPPGAREGAGMSDDRAAASACTSATAAATSPTTSTWTRSSPPLRDEAGRRRGRARRCSPAPTRPSRRSCRTIEEQHLDGLVVASCSPKLHTVTFRDVAKRAGMNPFQYTQVNVREQCSWAHTDDHAGATEKAIRLVARRHRPHASDRAARADRRRDDAEDASSSAAASPACGRPSAWPTSASASSSSRRAAARRLGRPASATCTRTAGTARDAHRTS